jgi:hypothetical protein
MLKKIRQKLKAVKVILLDKIHAATHRPRTESFTDAIHGIERILANLRATSANHDAKIADNAQTIQTLVEENHSRQQDAGRAERVVVRLEELFK